jgi:hypothetical protein
MFSFVKKIFDKKVYLDSKGVLKDLDKYFPVKTVTPNDTKDSIMYHAGQRAVIDFIKRRLEQG